MNDSLTPAESIWRRCFRWSYYLLANSTAVAVAARFIWGQDLSIEQLGVYALPVVALFLLCFCYMLTYLVWVEVKGDMKYLIRPLWVATMILLVASTVIGVLVEASWITL